MASSTQVATVCGYCGVGCGMDLHVSDGVVTKATGRADHPANRGRLCTKGNTTADMLRAGGRLDKALRRSRRGAEPEPIGLDAAITEVATRLSAIRDEHGPDSIALYVSGQMTTEAQYLANKLAKGYLRTQWIESNSRLCMASAGTGYKQSLGADGPPGSYDDLDSADLFLVLGANMADCHPILFLRMMERVRGGAKLVVVDPRRTATAAKADLHLPIRPGTDLALLNGLLRLVRDAGGVDADFVAAHTQGWEPLNALLDEYPVDVVAGITGLPEADLRAVADLICQTKNWMSLWTMGLNQSTHGTWNTNALCNLHLATGAICRPGAGPFSLTGQPNAMGGREMGYMGPGLPGQRSALDADDRAFAEARWDLEPGTIRAVTGTGTVDMYRQMAEGNIRAAWIICTNPVASVSNRASVIAGLERADFVVVQEAFSGAETSAYADVVLPAALWAESEGVMVNSERTITHCGAAMNPPGDAAPDWQLICRVATAMGYPGFDFDSAAEVFDELTGFHNPRTGWDLRGVDYRRLRSGPVQWPAPPGGADRNPIRYRNDGVSQDLHTAEDGTVPALAFPTPSRRARFLPRPHLLAAELPDDEFPMVFTTGRLAHQWHTMTKTGRVAKLNKLNPEPFLQLHPEDAARLGVRGGDKVEIRSRRGRAVLPANVDDAVRPGVCFAPMHWADAFAPDVAVNAVTNDAVDPDSLQPEFKVCAVNLAPVDTDSSPPERISGEARSPADALADVLGAPPAAMTLSDGERLFLSGLTAGIRANPPGAEIPVLPAITPLTPGNRAWVDGLLAGIFSRAAMPVAAEPGHVARQPVATVVWASQTGTAEEFATSCVERLNGAGIKTRLRGAEEVAVADLNGTVLFVVSTTGDGDPPDNGIALWDALAAAEPGDLDHLAFSVLGFGDSSYADFCGFARKLDARLEHLGAQRFSERALCEPDYETTAQAWTERIIAALTNRASEPDKPHTSAPQTHSRTNPLRATITSNVALCGAGSDKDVRSVGFHLPEGTLRYEAGDALGVWPFNSPEVVAEFLELTGLNGADEVSVGELTVPLAEALRRKLDITRITPDLLRFVYERHPDAELRSVIDDPPRFAEWAWGRQTLDLLTDFPVEADLDEWLNVLRPLAPRLYSISSSPLEDPTRVHVTPGIVRFESARGTRRHGVCSGHLAGLEPGAEVDIFVQRTKHFRPPRDPDARAIMIGPGTGIAPFRAFLHDRAARGHTGHNWLFFGERHEATDYYYRDELDALAQSGVLTRMDTAFSRDGTAKVYVQHRMQEHAPDLWKWIADGAYVYVCGDAARMARDVDETLRGIIAQQSGRSPQSATFYLHAMSAERRYVRDVY
ncbi:bifunctional nitrate reductase/sulfite reductase flavoprotein subunit alpha [Mycobacterium paraterrae]|uniref:Bifunctional nitrate reductase/sulfite reductase flavoprotein subunit alpha n=1 Tax=Mycobacterium paraterrae TaxID=577492 RepID=A0ABY3VDK1_9MYCO|nr:bifunctional nitrate reductase/sulfite reductase flavoprotein subunit alpha [Mycobacterium paraterrae]UMB67529.1 bifunctional nitrate reductase/sulfite reductase flavoprotein subunit alpha [Mycobacterium paraterrae]